MSTGHEFALIDWIRSRSPTHSRVPLGIGDDTASLTFSAATECLVTVDMLMEGTHFTLPETPARAIGRKALAVNLSDIAAMAGRPLAAVVSVALPRRYGTDLARELHEGLLELAEEFDVALAGGDTNIWDGPLVISVTLLGEAVAGRTPGPVRRRGAQPGDWILATGAFGGSLDGRHLSFRPRIAEALALHELVPLHAMIDVSDGLAADLGHILEESQVGAVLYADHIPINEAAKRGAGEKTPLEHALGDGEDFELLFMVAAADGERLLEHRPFETAISHIGEITAAAGECLLQEADGTRKPLPRAGWEHLF